MLGQDKTARGRFKFRLALLVIFGLFFAGIASSQALQSESRSSGLNLIDLSRAKRGCCGGD